MDQRRIISSLIIKACSQISQKVEDTLLAIATLIYNKEIGIDFGDKGYGMMASSNYVKYNAVSKVVESHFSPKIYSLLTKDVKLTFEVLTDLLEQEIYGMHYSSYTIDEFLLSYLAPTGTTIWQPFGSLLTNQSLFTNLKFFSADEDFKVAYFNFIKSKSIHADNFINEISLQEYANNINKREQSCFVPFFPNPGRNSALKTQSNFLERLIDNLPEGKRFAMITSRNLFTSSDYISFRKRLIDQEYYFRVINLPSRTKNAFENTSVSISLFLLEKRKGAQSFKYADITNDDLSWGLNNISYVEVPLGKVYGDHKFRFFNYNAPGFDVKAPKGFKLVELKTLVKPFHNSCNLNDELVPHLTKQDFMSADMQGNLFYDKIKQVPSSGMFDKIDCNILCFHSMSLQSVYILADSKNPVYCRRPIIPLVITDKRISAEYLCYVLKTSIVREQFDAVTSGVSVAKQILYPDLLNIKIPIPDTEKDDEFNELMSSAIYEGWEAATSIRLNAAENELISFKENIVDLIHLSGPYNIGIQTSLMLLENELEMGKSISADTLLCNGQKAIDVIRSAFESSQLAGYITSCMGSTIFENPSVLKANELLEGCLESIRSDIRFKDVVFSLSLPQDSYFIEFDEKAMKFLLNTILENALRHGFSNLSLQKQILLRLGTSGEYITLEIANNGNRVSPDFSTKLFAEKGGKCGPFAKSGRGGKFVADAMAFYNGSFDVITDDPKWSFIVKLYIPSAYV